MTCGDAAQHDRARIVGLVDGVAEPHDAVAAGHRVADPGLGAVGRADGVEGVERAARRAAVQRTRERAQRGDDRGADVGAGRRHDACGERRRVEAVVDAEDLVLLDGAGPARVGDLAVDHPEVVRGRPQLVGGATNGSPSDARCSPAISTGVAAPSRSALARMVSGSAS